jgi:hypothetical protein
MKNVPNLRKKVTIIQNHPVHDQQKKRDQERLWKTNILKT